MITLSFLYSVPSIPFPYVSLLQDFQVLLPLYAVVKPVVLDPTAPQNGNVSRACLSTPRVLLRINPTMLECAT